MSTNRRCVALFIDSLDPGGAETLVIAIARKLRDARIRAEIWHFGNDWLQAAAEKHELPIFLLDDKYFRRFYQLPLFALYLARIIRQRNIQLVHSHLYGAVIGATLPCLISKTRHVGTLHDLYSLSDRPGRLLVLRIAHIFGTEIATVAEIIERTILRRSIFGWRHLRTVHNGITITPKSDIKHKRPSNDDAPTVKFVCVARLVALKRIDQLILAAARIKKHLKYQIDIAGDGPERSTLEALAESMSVAEQVSFLGFRQDVSKILRESDCFVLPSSSEGLSYSVMEAMAAGIPAIVTDVGGNSELVVDGETGMLVTANDPIDLCEAMERAITSDKWRIQAGELARDRVQSEFSVQKMVSNYVSLYRLPDKGERNIPRGDKSTQVDSNQS